MSTELQKVTDFQTRMFERIRDSLGDLMTDEELKKVVEAAVKKAIYEPVTETRRRDNWSNPETITIAPSLVEKVAKELMRPMLEPMLRKHIEDNKEQFEKIMLDVIGKGFTNIVVDHINGMANGPLQDFGHALINRLRNSGVNV